MFEHKGFSFRTNRPIVNPGASEIRNHALQFDHVIKEQNFSILQSFSNRQDLRIAESLFIYEKSPDLNNNESSTNLLLVP